jgi:hypothetical protein
MDITYTYIHYVYIYMYKGDIQKRILESPRRYFGGQSKKGRTDSSHELNPSLKLQYDANYGKTKSLSSCVADSPVKKKI